jgi:hypothetical protein
VVTGVPSAERAVSRAPSTAEVLALVRGIHPGTELLCDPYPLPFHPLELGEDALRALFGRLGGLLHEYDHAA